MDIKFAKKTIMDQPWYLKYRVINKDHIEIVAHWAFMNYLNNAPKVDPVDHFDIVESKDGERRALQVIINRTLYNVTNPKHVFSYGEGP
jgi:hypothetical protein